MASELLSFRLSGHELEWLKNQQQEGETLNLTAKRLLLSLMNGTVDSTVDTTELEARIDKKIEAKFEEMYYQLSNNLNYILDKRLGTEQQTVDSVDTHVDRTVDTSVDTSDKSLEAKTIIQLRTMAKDLEIPFKVRDNKAKLISMISARKSP